MRNLARLALAALVAVLLPSAVFAQGTLAGVVKDTSGAVLPGVTVEAASPVLIEKVRTAVTDGNGRYQIVDLRPGTYSITFTLAGFNTSKRDGVALSGSGSITVDTELRVGALEETVTVTGEAPVVDTKSLTKQQVLSADLVDSLPSARNYVTLARMVSGTTATGNGSADVGGSQIQDVGGSLTAHGSRATDQRVTANGINTMTLQAGGNIGGQTPDVGSAAEVTIDTTSLSADLPTGGVRINFIPRDGGNSFANSAFFTMSDAALQSNNFDDELKAAGLTTPVQIVRNWDVNEAIGGPIKRDKVWFWFSTRYNNVATEAGIFENANAFKVNEWLYVPTTTPSVNKGVQQNNSIRVTYQANPKLKIAGTYKIDQWCNCPSQISATRTYEASRDRRFPRLRQEHAEFTSPITNKLLLEGVFLHLFERWGDMHLRVNGGSLEDPAIEAIIPQLISVTEQSTGLIYRGRDTNNNTLVPNFSYRVAASYVTGSHAFKTGVNRTHGFLEAYQYSMNPTSYRFNNGIPNRITQQARPYTTNANMDNDLGFFAQDRWTINRLTLNLAARYDMFQTSFPEQHLGQTQYTPTRDVTFPAQDNLDWKDFTYRTGLVYDLGGDGKTAIKVAFNKYLLGQTLNGVGTTPNPLTSLATTTARSWNDRGGLGVNGDYVPQCDLLNPAANGECGAIDNNNFGTLGRADLWDPDLLTGYGNRPANWEFSAGVQREIIPRVALDFGYFRRIWKNFQVTDNLLLAPSDFTQFNLTVPTDPNLTTSGQTITGLYDVVPTKFGQVSNLNTLSDKYGKQIDHWNGFDISVNARLQNGLTLSGGLGTGHQLEDNCEIVAKLPEMNNVTAAQAANTAGAPAQWRPAQFCHREEPWLTGVKALALYTIPKITVQVSGSFRSTPGTSLAPGLTATNAILNGTATTPPASTLGRPLSGNAANMIIGLEVPNTTYTERRNELDMRIGKVLRMGPTRSVVSIDIFNALNSNAMITQNQAYASYLRPQEILNARLMKFSWAFDF